MIAFISNGLLLIIGVSLFPNLKDWNMRTFFDVAKIVGGKSFEVSNHLTIDDGVILKILYKLQV